MGVICFTALGMTPVPMDGGNEPGWRNLLAERAGQVREQNSELLEAIEEDDKFSVVVIFSLTERHIMGRDIDNLVIPVLNTLFREAQADQPTGVLFPNVNDSRVFRLTAEKVVVSDRAGEGVHVVISW